MPWSSDAMCPAMLAYQVWEWTRSAPAISGTMLRSTPRVWIAAFAEPRSSGTEYDVTVAP